MLCADPRVRKISFTGSTAVGEEITRVAGIKRLSLELGANCPLIVLPDADLERVAAATATGGYVNAGQVCISVQRVLVAREVYGEFVERLTPLVEGLRTGHPLDEETGLGPVISEAGGDARRARRSMRRSTAGATLVTGGDRDGAVVAPSILGDVDPSLEISRSELFGPAVALTPVSGIDEAIAFANDSDYGLGAGLFTSDHRQRAAVCDRGRLRLDPDQLVAALALRPDALRRAQGKRDRQGRPAVGDRGDDGVEDGGVPPWLTRGGRSACRRSLRLDVGRAAGVACGMTHRAHCVRLSNIALTAASADERPTRSSPPPRRPIAASSSIRSRSSTSTSRPARRA